MGSCLDLIMAESALCSSLLKGNSAFPECVVCTGSVLLASSCLLEYFAELGPMAD